MSHQIVSKILRGIPLLLLLCTCSFFSPPVVATDTSQSALTDHEYIGPFTIKNFALPDGLSNITIHLL